MYAIKDVTIRGFNEVVQTIKGVAEKYTEQEHYITFVTFNSNGIKTHLDRMPVQTLNEIDGNHYQPEGMTPLFDAMGESFSYLRKVTDTQPDSNVLVTILTDGEENSSREYNGRTIKAIIDELKEKNWTFTYIGANHDVEKFAISISIENTLSYQANEADMDAMFSKEKHAREMYSADIREKKDVKKNYFKK
ncbi:MAG TPA: VWA domain-containing protein [Bacteroidales bacterium]|nr:VWA domain-containing protein [Bacteroidales bacterium]